MSGHNRLSARPALFSHDNKLLFVPSGSEIVVVATSTGETVCTLIGHTDAVSGLAFHNENNQCLLSASLDGTVRAWDVTAAVCLAVYHAGHAVIRMVAAPASHGRGVLYLVRALRQPGVGFGAEAVVLFHQSQHRESDDATSEQSVTKCRFDVVKAVVNVSAVDAPTGKSSKRKPLDGAKQLATSPILPKSKGLCVGLACVGRWLVVGSSSSLFLWPHDLAVEAPHRYSASKLVQSKLCCLAVHPEGAWVSVGDIRGRVHHIQCFPADDSFHLPDPVVASKHWHSREVCSVAYGPSGAYMLSGGHEGVLVVWQTDTGNSLFLPRLGAPIRSVSVSQSVTGSHPLLYAVSLVSNAVVGIDAASMKVLWTVRGLAISGYAGHARSLIGRLVPEPRTGCFVLDGVPNSGQLQMFDPLASAHIGNVEVVKRNYVSKMNVKTQHMMQLSKESQVASSSDVSVIACDFTHDGKWMMTVDSTTPNHSLKFWAATASVDAFALNTQVDNPHKDVPIVLRCHPRLPLVVTAAHDHSFKLWELTSVSAVPSASGIAPPSASGATTDVWKCRSVGYYKDLPVTAGCFSGDGSCLAVAYSHIITLWSPFSNTLKATLTHPCPDEPVIHMEFVGLSPYLFAATKEEFMVWNLLTASVVWSFPAVVSCVVTTTYQQSTDSGLLAIGVRHHSGRSGATDKHLDWNVLEFQLPSPVPIAVHSCGNKRPVALGYVPTNKHAPEMKSVLVAMDDTNSLSVLREAGVEAAVRLPLTSSHVTPFTAMYGSLGDKASKKRQRDEEPETSVMSIGAPTVTGSLLDAVPTHALCDVTALSRMLMPKLLHKWKAPEVVAVTSPEPREAVAAPKPVDTTVLDTAVVDNDFPVVVESFKKYFTSEAWTKA